MSSSASRMTTDERRRSILEAVRKVFAEKGFHGTTTRELAKAAGVSEALLFKHFPSKEALYCAMQDQLWASISHADLERVLKLQPSTTGLVVLVHFLVSKVLVGDRISPDRQPLYIEHLMLRSFLEDGDFARGMLKRFEQSWLFKFVECLQAARAEGLIVDSPVPDHLRGRLIHAMAVLTMIQLLPNPPAAEFGMSREELVKHSVWFALRGLGMRDEAIERFYTSEALRLLVP